MLESPVKSVKLKKPDNKIFKGEEIKAGKWYCYLLRSLSPRNRTYIGASTDPFRRLRQHNGEIGGGAKYTRQWRPWQIVTILGPYKNGSEAMRVEWRWKRFRGPDRFKYRRWVAELDDNAEDKDADKHHHKSRRRRGRKRT